MTSPTMFEVPAMSPLRERQRYRRSMPPPREQVKETLPSLPRPPSRPKSMPPQWDTAAYSFDQEHAYQAHVQRMTSSSSGNRAAPALRRHNAVRTPLRRVRQLVRRFWRRHLLRKSSQVSFHFTRSYLSRDQSFVITPDISAWNMKFRKRDLIKKRPRPLSWQSARPVKVVRHGLTTPPSSPLVGDESWTKVSLPVQPGYTPVVSSENAAAVPATSSDAPPNVAPAGVPQRRVSGPRPPPGAVSPTPSFRGLRGPRPLSLPTAVSGARRPVVTSAPAPRAFERHSALLPRRDTDVSALAVQETETEPVDVSEAMQFVNAWSTYLRRAIAQRAVLRRMAERNDPLDAWGSSVWSDSDGRSLSSGDDDATILEQSFMATPSQTRLNEEGEFGRPGPVLPMPPVLGSPTSKRQSHLSTFSDMSLGEIEEVQRVPTFRSITARYSHLFANHGIREISSTWVPEPEPQDSSDSDRRLRNGDEGRWMASRIGATGWRATDDSDGRENHSQ